MVTMPPKAKAKAKGKARAKVVLRRPAGLLRPAAREEVEAWRRGQAVHLRDIPLEALGPGASLVLEEADYFGANVKVAGLVKRVEITGEARYISR